MSIRFSYNAVLIALAAVPLGAAGLGSPHQRHPDTVQFNRDIRPILADNCFACHGPDHNKRQAGLRMDVPDPSLSRVVVPGHPGQSRLISRILATDNAKRMPPPSTRKILSEAQKELLKRWIAGGGSVEKHWSLVPLPASVPVPAVSNPAWCRNPIDRFVLARLERVHL